MTGRYKQGGLMFLKYKTKKAVKKIINGASRKEIKSALGDVVREVSGKVAKKIDKMEYRLPLKVTVSR